jgi:hypothetical protein
VNFSALSSRSLAGMRFFEMVEWGAQCIDLSNNQASYVPGRITTMANRPISCRTPGSVRSIFVQRAPWATCSAINAHARLWCQIVLSDRRFSGLPSRL